MSVELAKVLRCLDFTVSAHALPPTKLGQVFTMEKARVISLPLFFSAHHLFYHPSAWAPQKKGRVSGPEWGQVLEIAPNHCWVSSWVSKLRIMVIRRSNNQF